MNLNLYTWKEFEMGRLFDIKKGKRLTVADQEEGDTNYIGAIDSNNGVSNHIGQKPIHSANTISLSYNGSVGEAFYQSEPYWATDDVNALYPCYEQFNKYIGLFMVSVIRQEKYKFSYGRKWTLDNMNKTRINLPIQHNSDRTPFIDAEKRYSDNGYVPDWKFMEDYIKSLKHKPLTTKNKKSDMVLDVVTWEEFKVGNLFDIHPTKTIKDVSSKDCDESGTTPLVVNQSYDNGITGRVNYEPTETGGIITFSDTWEGKTFFYQKEDFIGFSHVQGMYPKYEMNENVLIFISVILEFEANDRYSYGRKKRRDLIEKSYIKLPVRHNVDGTIFIDDKHTYSEEGYVPDWGFMENYIKSLPYGDRL